MSVESLIHGGFLAEAAGEVEQRLQQDPSRYDRLLASIFFRLSGRQQDAVEVLRPEFPTDCFDVVYNTIQAECFQLDLAAARATALAALNGQKGTPPAWSDAEQAYFLDITQTCSSLHPAAHPDHGGPLPGNRQDLQANRYVNLDCTQGMLAPGWVDHRPRRARIVRARFDPQSRCWREEASGAAVQELLQPGHDFRSLFGGAKPTPGKVEATAGNGTGGPSTDGGDRIQGPCIFLEFNPHFGHFLTQSASFASALPYAEAITSREHPAITVLSQAPMAAWAEELLQKACQTPLIFKAIPEGSELQASQLVVAPQTWIEWHYCHADHRRLFQRAARTLLQERTSPAADPASLRLLYFSRSRVQNGLRRSINEVELEQELGRMGFTILHPQDMPLGELCHAMNQAELIAGSIGSAMHNILFRTESSPLTTLNFAHFLPAINCSLVEGCCGISENLYTRSSEERASPEGNLLEFDLARCRNAAEAALAGLGR